MIKFIHQLFRYRLTLQLIISLNFCIGKKMCWKESQDTLGHSVSRHWRVSWHTTYDSLLRDEVGEKNVPKSSNLLTLASLVHFGHARIFCFRPSHPKNVCSLKKWSKLTPKNVSWFKRQSCLNNVWDPG